MTKISLIKVFELSLAFRQKARIFFTFRSAALCVRSLNIITCFGNHKNTFSLFLAGIIADKVQISKGFICDNFLL